MSPRRAFALALTIAATGALCAPAQVSASTETQIVAGARVAAVADRVARGIVTGADRTVAAAYQVADQRLPVGEIAIAPAGTPFVSQTYVGVPVAITVDGRIARTVVAGYRVTTYVSTAAAARDLAPGAVLAESDLVMERVASNGRPVVGAASLLGRKLSSAAAKGTPVYVEQTVPDTIVKAGQGAVLVIRDGSVALTADVVARTGGALGDSVTVFNPQTQKALAAVVTGKNRVELVLPGGER